MKSIHAVNNGDSIIVTIPTDYLTNAAEMAVTTNVAGTINDEQGMLNYVTAKLNDTTEGSEFGRYIDDAMETAMSDGEPWIDEEDCDYD